MKELQQVFEYGGRQVRTVLIDGEPHFVAKDVCDILTLTNPTEAMRGLDDDEKTTLRISEGGPEVNAVTEAGLYSLVIRSNKAEAKAFKRWITHEVLPSIRKTGGYALPTMTPAQLIAAVAQQAAEQEQKILQLTAAQASTAARVEQIENKIEKRITDDFALQLVTPTQIGKMFEPQLSGQAVNTKLNKAGLQWRAGGEWVATTDGKKYSSAEPLTLEGGKMIYQLKWQRRVKELIS